MGATSILFNVAASCRAVLEDLARRLYTSPQCECGTDAETVVSNEKVDDDHLFQGNAGHILLVRSCSAGVSSKLVGNELAQVR